MNPIRAATMSVTDLDAALDRFQAWLDFCVVERAVVSPDLAHRLDAGAIAGARQAVLRPASGSKTDLRLIEAAPAPGPPIMASLGWTALEICVQDVHAAHARFAEGPFTVIGPPSAVPGLPTIHPMQVEGPDGEVVFLTQILTRDPAAGLPTARAPIDSLFIVVLACRDLATTAAWTKAVLGADVAPPIEIPYRTLSRAFGLAAAHRHTITTATRDGHIFLELDQYPPEGAPRGRSPQALMRGVAMVTLSHHDLDAIAARWRVPPAVQSGAIYEGRRSGVITTPEGALIELVEDRP